MIVWQETYHILNVLVKVLISTCWHLERITFLRKPVWLPRGGHSALGTEASRPCRITPLFDLLQMLQNCKRACYLIPATTIWSPFLLFMLLRRPSGIFRNINLLSSEKYLWECAKEILHKPSRCIMWRHLAAIKWGDCSQAHHFPLLFTSSWFFNLSVYTL